MKLGALFGSLLSRREASRARAFEPPGPPPPPAPIPARPELVFTPFLAASDMPVSFADPALPDIPLIHVNDAFCELTGYAREDAVGVNCRFLQGRLTRASEAAAIREAIDAKRYVFTRLLNYRRDGTLFDNALQLGQLRDTRGQVRYLFGLQWDVTRTVERIDERAEVDLRDRTLSPRLRMLERLAGHVVRRSVELGGGAAGVPLVERLVALSRPYQFPVPDAEPDRAALTAQLEYLLDPYTDVPGVRVRLDGAPGFFAADIVGPLALWVHELASASRRGGALSGNGGEVRLSWGYPTERGRPRIAFHWDELGPGDDPAQRRYRPFAASNVDGGHGARIARELVEFVGGRSVTRTLEATVDAALVLPNGGVGRPG